MKIGVLTYHRVINFGAILQAYCVCEFYKSLGHDVRLIDLRSKKTEMTEYRSMFSLKKLKFNKSKFESYREMRKFLTHNFRLTAKIYDQNPRRFARFLESQNFDLVSVGSDTVWELRDPGYTALTVNEFFLPYYPGKKLSFSASMDPINTSIPVYSDLMEKRVKALSSFDYINVRDKPTQDALKMFGLRSNITVDPTIIMQDHEIFKVSSGVSSTLIGVQVQSESLCIKLNKTLPGSIVNVYSGFHVEGISNFPSNLSVKDYLAKLGALQVLITDRFHGTLLTLLASQCSVPVIAYENPKKWISGTSKIRDLFIRLDIEQYIASDEETVLRILHELQSGSYIWPALQISKHLQELALASKALLSSQLSLLA